MTSRQLIYMLAIFMTVLVVSSTASANLESKLKGEIEITAHSESNIYHSYVDTIETSSLLNVVNARVRWDTKSSKKLTSRFTGYAKIDMYPKYSNRNKNSIGVVFSPTLRYRKNGRITFKGDLSRRNKDLVDAAGQTLPRTLKKWELDIALAHRYDFGKLITEQTIRYSGDNYDEQEVPTFNGVDTIMVPLGSYDYHFVKFGFHARYKISKKLRSKIYLDSQKRNYSERKTYSIQLGAGVGRPSAIRNFRENSIEVGLEYRFTHDYRVSVGAEYLKRKDNFENFYGYHTWQYRLELDLRSWTHNRTKLSFRIKNKDYPNYYTSRIGSLNRVAIDYADIKVENEYDLTRRMTILVYLQNYNKTSNDPLFDYHDLTTGLGVRMNF